MKHKGEAWYAVVCEVGLAGLLRLEVKTLDGAVMRFPKREDAERQAKRENARPRPKTAVFTYKVEPRYDPVSTAARRPAGGHK